MTVNLSTLSTNAVSVDPEAQAHVGLSDQVSDSTTANVGVSVSILVSEHHASSTTNRVDDDRLNSRRGAIVDDEVEHVVIENVKNNVALRATERQVPQCNLLPDNTRLIE